MNKSCESCGMPMLVENDYCVGDTNSKYCVYCCDGKGKLKPFEQKIEEIAGLMLQSSDISKEKAVAIAKEKLLKMPAWKNMGS